MPKPQGTYLRTSGTTKVAHGADQAKQTKEDVARHKREEFEAQLKRRKIDFRAFRRTIEECKKLVDTPKTERGRQMVTLGKVLQDLDDLADHLSRSKELTAELGPASRIFLVKTKNVDIDGVDLTKALVAAAMFIAALEKALSKLKSAR